MLTTRTWIVAASLAVCSSTVFATPGLPPEGNPKNGLSVQAFSENALTTNPTALAHLLASPLDSSVFADPTFAAQMSDPNAQAVMTEIVRCARNNLRSLSFTDPSTSAVVTFRGELGLCEQSAHPEIAWPNKACREVITSCVASRVNALHESIPISIRGDQLPAPKLAIATDTTYRAPTTGDPGEGSVMPSFRPPLFCTGSCKWTPWAVGTCTVGTQVQLTTSDTACNVGVRVCTGIAGCADAGQQNPPGVLVSSSYAGSSTNACNGVSFTCPSSGVFSTMFLLPKSTSLFPTPPAMVISSGTYPAPETSVFAALEAGFYGDMFDAGDAGGDPVALRKTCTWHDNERWCQPDPVCAAQGCDGMVPYDHVYACFSAEIAHDNDANGAAYMNARICGLPGGHCFRHAPTRCHYQNATDNQTKGSHCTKSGDVFGACQDPTGTDHTLYNTITTYLNARCDFFTADTACAAAGIRERDGSREEADADDDAGGCAAAGGAGGGGLVIALAALVASRRRR